MRINTPLLAAGCLIVVNNVPPPDAEPPDYVALPFLAAGAPDKARRMRFEIVPRLPTGAEIMLELPSEFAELLRVRPRATPQFKNPSQNPHECQLVYLRVNHCGCIQFPEVVFPAKARIRLRLLVKIPKELRHYDFDLFARQLYEGEEVGRVTWRLPPLRRAERPK